MSSSMPFFPECRFCRADGLIKDANIGCLSCASAKCWKDHFTARFNGVHAFGNNSAESEPIWMKTGALWVHSRGLALADFGRDLRSSESWRARRNVGFCQISNSRLDRVAVGQISRDLNTTRQPMSRWILSGQNLGNFPVRGHFSTKKLISLVFQRLATSGRHSCAMVIDRRKFITKWSLYRKCSFHFSPTLACTLRTRNPQFSATSATVDGTA